MDDVDDLGVVDPLEVDRGNAEVTPLGRCLAQRLGFRRAAQIRAK
jgi:hypothetical protein